MVERTETPLGCRSIMPIIAALILPLQSLNEARVDVPWPPMDRETVNTVMEH